MRVKTADEKKNTGGQNQYGRDSRLVLSTALRGGRTAIDDLYFTAPLKVMKPFESAQGPLEVMLLSASAGLMEGDSQSFDFRIGEGTSLKLLSQSFEKIHKMQTGQASRRTQIIVGHGAFFDYRPLPVIPFAGSAFDSETVIRLSDETARFILSDIVSCGRYASGERFRYTFYRARVNVYCGEKLVYRENTHFRPDDFDMSGLGLYEGYTHAANLALFHCALPEEWVKQTRQLIDDMPQVTGGVSRLHSGDYIVRILGNGADRLLELTDRIAGK